MFVLSNVCLVFVFFFFYQSWKKRILTGLKKYYTKLEQISNDRGLQETHVDDCDNDDGKGVNGSFDCIGEWWV